MIFSKTEIAPEKLVNVQWSY
jgi:ribonuclease HI